MWQMVPQSFVYDDGYALKIGINSEELNLIRYYFSFIQQEDKEELLANGENNIYPNPSSSEIYLNIKKIGISSILDFFSIPKINYFKEISLEGRYNFSGTEIEKGEGFLNFISKDENFKGKGQIKDFCLENLKIQVEEKDFISEIQAKLPFSSEEKFFFSGDVKEASLERIKKILKPFLPDTGVLKGSGRGNFNIFGTYEDILIESKMEMFDCFYEGLPFGEGEVEIQVYKEEVLFKKIFFKNKGGILEGMGSISKGINFKHKNWYFPIPFSSILDGEGTLSFSPEFLISGEVNKTKVDFFDFGEINFEYDYDGKVFHLKQLEALKDGGILKLKGVYEEKFELEGNTYDFPLYNEIKISSNLKA
ncbi:MAG: hypothetical protein WHV67_10810, partial [Thermoanaerobaculia bacterium]